MIKHQMPFELLRPATGKCLGAAFCTYTFDEHFFDSVLAALLPIHADPESDERMFLAEARRRLRETPVVVLADGNSYSGGHRLPFHLILSPLKVAFHARLALLLFEDHARLTVGSANLTPTSFGESADLCAVLRLDYAKDNTLLLEAVAILERAGAQGEGFTRFVRQCQAMVKRGRSARSAEQRLLASTPEASVLAQFLTAIPKAAKIQAAHLFAPTQPEDDACAAAHALEPLATWLQARAKRVPLDIALSWSEASIAPPAERTIIEPEQLVGYLVAERQGLPGAETIRWSPVARVAGGEVHLTQPERPTAETSLPRKAVTSAMQAEPPRLWAIPEVTGVGLLEAIEPLSETLDARFWLYPELQMQNGEVRRRPFHAKLVAVCTTERGRRFTHLLLGCPNFSRSVAEGEHLFEIGLHLRLDGHLSATDLSFELVPAPPEGFYLEDRSLAVAEARPAVPLERVAYDAKSHLLQLEWQPRAPECRVTYQRELGEEEIFKGRPGLRTSISAFVLGHESAEVRVSWEERQALVPISVQNVSFLRADEPECELRFHELVALQSRERRALAPSEAPTAREVFQAQQALASSLATTGPLWGAFEVAMDGPVGLRAFAETLLASEECDRSEAWLYGLEMCQILSQIDWSADPFGTEKRRVVEAFITETHARLRALAPNEPWRAEVVRFYGGRP